MRRVRDPVLAYFGVYSERRRLYRALPCGGQGIYDGLSWGDAGGEGIGDMMCNACRIICKVYACG